MKDIKIKVTARHYRSSDGYTSHTHCPLAKALQEMFPEAERIFVTVRRAFIDDNTYTIKNFIGVDLNVQDYGFYTEYKFVEVMKKRAEARKKVISFDVELILEQ